MAKTKPKQKAHQTRAKSVSRKRTASRIPTLRGRDLESAVERFQSEPAEKKAHDQWKQIEGSVFGVQFED